MKTSLIIVLVIFSITANAQSLNNNWKSNLNAALNEFKACNNASENGINPCNKFLGESLKIVYNIDDFYSKNAGRYMLVNEMADFLESSNSWTEMGKVFDQNTLDKAQAQANAGKAVIAIYIDASGLGHMSVILPGDMHTSATWSLKVPNSSSFFTIKPQDAYIDKGLSYAFNKSQAVQVKLYTRNY